MRVPALFVGTLALAGGSANPTRARIVFLICVGSPSHAPTTRCRSASRDARARQSERPPCSAARRAIDATTITVSGCVGIEVGFDSHLSHYECLRTINGLVEQPGVLACLSLRRTLSLNPCQYTVCVSAKCTDFSKSYHAPCFLSNATIANGGVPIKHGANTALALTGVFAAQGVTTARRKRLAVNRPTGGEFASALRPVA